MATIPPTPDKPTDKADATTPAHKDKRGGDEPDFDFEPQHMPQGFTRAFLVCVPDEPPHDAHRNAPDLLTWNAASLVAKLKAFLKDHRVKAEAWIEDIRLYVDDAATAKLIGWGEDDEKHLAMVGRRFRRAMGFATPTKAPKPKAVPTPPAVRRRRIALAEAGRGEGADARAKEPKRVPDEVIDDDDDRDKDAVPAKEYRKLAKKFVSLSDRIEEMEAKNSRDRRAKRKRRADSLGG